MTEHKPWLSLPDEDPPERGFAELMAAARVKADAMANPPWWKRLFTIARRPPVLALATVVVVVCGVLVVGRPHDRAASPAPALDVPAGSLDTRARGTVPEAPPPPPPVEKKQAVLHAEPTLDKQAGETESLDQADTVKPGDTVQQAQTVERPEMVKAPEVRKAKLAAPDPLARCREAAARRDCAAAKACVQQAGRVDVGNDAALKSCL